MIEEFKNTTPLFICGHYRSGTSMMNHLLDGHPEIISNGYETKFFTHFVEAMKTNGSAEKALNESLLRIWEEDHEYRLKYFPDIQPEDFRKQFFDSLGLFEHAYGKYLEANTYAYGLITGQISSKSKYWIEKTPHNEFYFDEIVNIWPDAVFLHVYRDPRDLHTTLRRRSEMKFSVRTTIHNWRRSYKQMLKNKSKWGSERYLTLKYEDFVEQPKQHFDAINRQLGMEYNEAQLTPTMAGGNVHWKGNAVTNKYEGISNKSVGQWLRSKDDPDYRIIEVMLKKPLLELGYDLKTSASASDNMQAFYHELAIIYKRLRYTLKGKTEGAI